MSPNGPPSIFLLYSNKLESQKAQRVHLSTTLKTSRLLFEPCYSADFGRFRLVCIVTSTIEVTEKINSKAKKIDCINVPKLIF